MEEKRKKILKIIQIIYDILSLGFIVLVVVAMAIVPKSDRPSKNNESQITEKVKRNYGYNDEYGIQAVFYETDFASSDFILKFINGVASVYSPSFSTGNTDLAEYTWNVNNYIAEINYTQYMTNRFLVGSIVLNKYQVFELTYQDNDYIQSRYQLKVNNEEGNYFFFCNYIINSPCYDYSGHDIADNCISSAVYRTTALNSWNTFCVIENNNDSFSPFIEYVVKNDINDKVDRYNEGYQNGYNRGYAIGNQIGNSTGYDRGFVDGARGIETNAFTVMGQVFSTISDIFSIQVLPSLPLWVLVFTPLIVVVVIVIVKLIKG